MAAAKAAAFAITLFEVVGSEADEVAVATTPDKVRQSNPYNRSRINTYNFLIFSRIEDRTLLPPFCNSVLTWGTDGAEIGVVLEEVLVQLGENVLAVGVLPEGGAVRLYLVHEGLALARLRHVDHLLHDVVRVLVLHHDVQRALRPENIFKTEWYSFLIAKVVYKAVIVVLLKETLFPTLIQLMKLHSSEAEGPAPAATVVELCE